MSEDTTPGGDRWQDRSEYLTFLRRVDERGAVTGDGDVLGKFFDLYRYSCEPSIRFDWDQWSRCYIECDHGKWFRDSAGVNFTEAFVLARQEWERGAAHPTWDEAEE